MRIGPFNVNRWKIKRSLVRAAASLPPRSGERVNKRVVVLCHHSVHPDRWIASASPALFDEQLAWLASECKCVPFQEIRRYANGEASDKPVVAITFDDGYDDNHEFALPLLTKWGLPATFFVTPGFIEQDPSVVARFHKLMKNDDFSPMSWSQVSELRDAGMEIGAHTYTHPNLALTSSAQVAREFSESKDMLEQRLGAAVPSMAYPFGKPRRHVSKETIALARSAGFEQAGLILHRAVKKSDDPCAIPRFNTVKETVDEVRARVLGYLDLVGAGQSWAPTWMGKLVTPEDYTFGPG